MMTAKLTVKALTEEELTKVKEEKGHIRVYFNSGGDVLGSDLLGNVYLLAGDVPMAFILTKDEGVLDAPELYRVVNGKLGKRKGV